MAWWQLVIAWVVVLALSAAVVPRLVRSLRAPTGSSARGRPAAPLPLWQAAVWLLVVIAALVITGIWATSPVPLK